MNQFIYRCVACKSVHKDGVQGRKRCSCDGLVTYEGPTTNRFEGFTAVKRPDPPEASMGKDILEAFRMTPEGLDMLAKELMKEPASDRGLGVLGLIHEVRKLREENGKLQQTMGHIQWEAQEALYWVDCDYDVEQRLEKVVRLATGEEAVPDSGG